MRKIYNIFNEDGAGGIDEDEFTMGLRYRLGLNVPEKISDGLFHKMDRDGEGSLSIVELCHYLFPPTEDFQGETWVEKADNEQIRKQQLQGLLQLQASRRGPPSKALNRKIRALLNSELSKTTGRK